jgi:hypothetical protein
LLALRFGPLDTGKGLKTDMLRPVGGISVRDTHLLDELFLLFLDLEDLGLHGVLSDKLINMNWFLLANSVYPIDGLAFYSFLLCNISEHRRYFIGEIYKPATI